MQVDSKDVRYCLEKAVEASDHYKQYVLDGHGFHRSVKQLLYVCQTYLQKKILVKGVQIDGSDHSFRGVYLSFGDRYEIYVLSGMDFCWSRFVLCKEIFHVLIDAEDYRTVSIYNHLEEIAAKFPVLDAQPGAAATSEFLAELAAMEFLFPYSERLLQKESSNPIDYGKIADLYKIPQFYVEMYMSDHYMVPLGMLMPNVATVA